PSLGAGEPEPGGSDRASWSRATVATSAAARPSRTNRRERSMWRAVADLLDGQCPRHGGNRMDRAAVLVGARLQRGVLVRLGGAAVDGRLVLHELRAVGRANVDVVRDRRRVLILEEDRERLAGIDLEGLH